MSPKKQVLPLRYMCKKIIYTKLIQVLSDERFCSYSLIADYLKNATHVVVQELLEDIMDSVNLDAYTRFRCFQVLLRDDVKKLNIGILNHLYCDSILKLITEKGKELEELHLAGLWVLKQPCILTELVRNLTNLKILIITGMADDEVLEAITKCKNLWKLDISGPSSFTIQGLTKLKSESLTDLGIDISDFICVPTYSDFHVVAEILKNLPNLNYLNTYSFTGRSLLSIYEKNAKFRTRLKYLHDRGTTEKIMNAIINTCENLESIYIDTPKQNVICKLSHLKKLFCVKVNHYNSADLFNYLRTSGLNLQILKLRNNRHVSLDLSDIWLSVPRLRVLECWHLKLNFSSVDTFFMNLEEILISSCDISDGSVESIFMNCPFLKELAVDVVNITDENVFRLCAECDFRYLETLRFSRAPGLTCISVEWLMRRCPNLRKISNLSGWDIGTEDIEYLKSMILYTNTDLSLL